MAELIQKTDTLNEGREKLNEAIKDAETAKGKSESADVKASQALAKSESTQTQLDTIVIEGDSSVEAAQARVDEKGVGHTTLKDRIDDGFTKVTSQLNETSEKLNFTQHAFNHVRNSDAAITHMINTGLTYAQNDDFVYGNSGVLNSSDPETWGSKDENGKWRIDCSAFINALLQDIPFEKSAYVNKDKDGYGVNYGSIGGYKFTSDDSYAGGRLLAHDLAKFAYDRGWTFEPNENYSNVEVGDMILFSNNPVPHFWRDIGHIGVVTDVQYNPEINDIVTFRTLESAGQNYAVDFKQHNSLTLPYSKAFLIARFPLKDPMLQTKALCNVEEVSIQSDEFNKNIKMNEMINSLKLYTIYFTFKSNSLENYPQIRYRVDGELKTLQSFPTYNSQYSSGHRFKYSFWLGRNINIDTIGLYHFKSNSESASFENIKIFKGLVSNEEEVDDNISIIDGGTIKMSNGVMIITDNVIFHNSELQNTGDFKIKTINFSDDFIDAPSISLGLRLNTTNLNNIKNYRAVISKINTNSVEVACAHLGDNNSITNAFVSIQAIGRWK